MTWSWNVGRVAGIDLYLHPSFLLLLAFVGLSQGGLLAILMVAAVFGCVVLHELGHALTARAYGIATADITLYPIGGVARLERLPRKPGAELLITLAGPAVNLAIALALGTLLWAWSLLSPEPSLYGPSLAEEFVGALLSINLLLALFNLIPAFPMDGGRVLRALLSGWLGRLRATEVAAGLGQILAVAFGAWSLVQGHWLQVILATFIYIAAQAELARVREEEEVHRPRPRRRPDDDGVWIAPPGQRWVKVGDGVWQLAPVVVTTTRPGSPRF